ncbi:MAG: hypothetical protein R3F36_03995 [Candidatus Competibacteraceae bacterium]
MLEDIERIEVIRGPGASLWGANAVNGVINIITKSARIPKPDQRDAGNPKNTIVGLRYSGQLGDGAHYRLYGKFLDQDGLLDAQGQDAEDDWRLGSGGFRLDWSPSDQDSFSMHGGLFDESLQQNFLRAFLDVTFSQLMRDKAQGSGGYLQGRWERVLSDASRLSLQIYYQNQQRQDAM